MSKASWVIFACNVNTGPHGDDQPQTEWAEQFRFADTCHEACIRARRFVNDMEYDLAIIMYRLEGKWLELYGTFGFRSAKNDYDIPGTRSDAFALFQKFSDAVLSSMNPISTKE